MRIRWKGGRSEYFTPLTSSSSFAAWKELITSIGCRKILKRMRSPAKRVSHNMSAHTRRKHMLYLFTHQKTGSIDQGYGVGSDAATGKHSQEWATSLAPVAMRPKTPSLLVEIGRAGDIESVMQAKKGLQQAATENQCTASQGKIFDKRKLLGCVPDCSLAMDRRETYAFIRKTSWFWDFTRCQDTDS